MTSSTLQIAQVSNRGNKFAILFGNSVIAKFKTADQAKKSLESKKDFYEYWAKSVSVSVNNSKKTKAII